MTSRTAAASSLLTSRLRSGQCLGRLRRARFRQESGRVGADDERAVRAVSQVDAEPPDGRDALPCCHGLVLATTHAVNGHAVELSDIANRVHELLVARDHAVQRAARFDVGPAVRPAPSRKTLSAPTWGGLRWRTSSGVNCIHACRTHEVGQSEAASPDAGRPGLFNRLGHAEGSPA